MVTGSGVQVRFACLEDLEQIGNLLPDLAGPLFPERFPGRSVADFCRWKYFSNPTGEAIVGIAVDGPRVVSLVTAVPKRVQVGSGVLLIFELGDFITAPDYRNRGLFSSLIDMVCGEAAQRGASFAYVRPNPSSFRILVKGLSFLEARKMDERRYLVPSGFLQRRTGIPRAVASALGIDWITRHLLLPSVDRSITVEPVTHFGDEIDELWASVRHLYSFSLVRDRQYLNWRYTDCPTPYRLWLAHRNGRTAGYVVAFANREEPTGHLVDVFTHPGATDVAAALVRAAVDSLLASGAQLVYTWTPQSGAESAAAQALRSACRLVTKPHLHVAVRFLDSRMNASHLPSGGWQLTLGDFDGI